MDVMNDPLIFTCVLMLQAAGLVSMAMVRLRFSEVPRRCCQALFFACLIIVGCVTMLAIGTGSSAWLSSATTLSLMAVGSILDLGRTGEFSVI